MTRQTTTPVARLNLTATNRLITEVARIFTDGDGDLNPAYQRGSVWTNDQRIALVRSWLMGAPVPAVIINNRFTGSGWPTNADGLPQGGYLYAVVDGKQRIETAIAWLNGDFAVPASWFDADDVLVTEDTEDGPYVRYTGLTKTRQRFGGNFALPVVESTASSLAEEADLFLLVNGAGTPQTDADMAHAASMAAAN